MEFVTISDIERLFRPLSADEKERAEALIPIVRDSLMYEAEKVGKDLEKLAESTVYANVVKSVIVDVVARALNTSTTTEPMTQMTQSAMGYSATGTFLVPGGGLFIKKSELDRLGLRRQRMGAIECSME